MDQIKIQNSKQNANKKSKRVFKMGTSIICVNKLIILLTFHFPLFSIHYFLN